MYANSATIPSASSVSIQSVPLPEPRCSVGVRPALSGVDGEADVGFIDRLQKMHSHMVGWFPRKQVEKYVEAGNVLIAQDHTGTPVGYVIAADKYAGRDDVGIVYQLNVLPLKQRNLIGATLVKACFERAAYGCRLYSCWCAQDIQANWFWESIGFLPLAFRTGSRSKQRTHIYWQRRVREGDNTTPYWFPSQTHAGAVREDRLVLPIPPGTHWRDAKPLVLPQDVAPPPPPKTLPGGAPLRTRPEAPAMSQAQKVAIVRSRSKHLGGLPPGKAAVITAGGLKYIDRADYVPEPEPPKPKRAPRNPAPKHDPKHIAFVRELRDRFLEQLNEGLIALEGPAKYEVGRMPVNLSGHSTANDAPLQLPHVGAE